uniref:DegT/DnrJ/EryC1/StrS family aminotransferase n=1 Tax=Idiomarina sp. TaxID=1874361 RepID=UPI00258EFC62
LWAQLESAGIINEARLKAWDKYLSELRDLETAGLIQLPTISEGCRHNAHMFYIKVANLAERSELLEFLKERNIMAAFHYVPLHTASAGERFGRFHGQDKYTTMESERLMRLPLWYGITELDQNLVVGAIKEFYA